MFIRLVNTLNERRGDPLIININSIVCVYEEHVPGGSLSTVIYANPQLAWHVEESVAQVEAKIDEALKSLRK
jgi:hypothetical protein